MKRTTIIFLWGFLALLPVTAQPAGVVLDTLKVKHIDGNGVTHEGTIICNKTIAHDLRDIFAELYKAKYPIERIRPISEYDDNDEQSMQANNTSCYCYRQISGSTKLSKHARGLAMFPYKIKRGDLCYRLFIQHGFRWGGDWKSKKDYQHFER